MENRNLPLLSRPQAPIQYLQPAIPQAYANPGMSIAQIVAILRAYIKQSAVIGLLVFAGMATMAISKPKAYTATATLQVNYEINDPLGGKEFPVGLIGGYVATQMELLSGPVVLSAVVNKLKLYDDKGYAGNLKLDEDLRRTTAEKALEKNVAIEQGRYGSQLIFVRYTADNPNEASDIANAIADVYTTREYQNPDSLQNAEAKAQYDAQLQELRQKVTTAQNELADFQKRTGLITGNGGDLEMAALANLEGQLQDARSKRRQAEVTAGTNRDIGETLGSNTIQTLRGQLRTQLAKMDEYRATDGPKHPRVLELQAQIDATRKALDEESRIDGGDSDAQLHAAQRLESKLMQAVDEQRKRVINERQMKEDGERFRLNLEMAQTAYRKALDSYEQISRSSSSKYNGINLISRAQPPTQGTGSKTRTGLIIGLFAGIIVGLASVFVWGMFDRRIRCRDDIERDYGIPVIVEFTPVQA